MLIKSIILSRSNPPRAELLWRKNTPEARKKGKVRGEAKTARRSGVEKDLGGRKRGTEKSRKNLGTAMENTPGKAMGKTPGKAMRKKLGKAMGKFPGKGMGKNPAKP